MRILLKVTMPTERANQMVIDGTLSKTIESILSELNPEAAYFTEERGLRTGFIFCDLASESQIPAIAEPWFLALGAKVEFRPAMVLDDLKKAGPGFENAIRKYGK
jgi:hypothetical protein